MIGFLTSAIAAPVLVEETPDDRLARCVVEAEAEASEVGYRPSPAGRSDRVAVVVGVPCHEDPTIPSLSYGARDAARVAQRLEVAGFAVVPLVTLVTRADLDLALDRAEALLEPGGTLLVYFSGHGVLREEEGRVRRYLVFTDTDLAELPTTAMPVPALEARVARIPAATRVVVQDTCFAARPGGKSVGFEVGGEKGIALPEPGGRVVRGDVQLYASRFYEQAIESPAHRGSVYTWHLLDGLDRGDADLDGDGCVGLVEAHEWAALRTEEERHGFQVPQLRGDAPENLLLGCTPHEASRAVVGAPAGDSWLVQVAQEGEVVSRGTSALEPGRYHVRIDRLVETTTDVVQRRVLNGPLGVRAGEWLDLRSEIDRRSPYGIVEAIGLARATDDVPSLAAGLGGWWAGRDRGFGRPALGVAARASSNAKYSESEALGRIGWWWGFRRSGDRPRADRDRRGRSTACTGWWSRRRDSRYVVVPALRTQLTRGPALLAVELGAQVLVVEQQVPGPSKAEVRRLDTVPSLGIALGMTL